MKHYKLQVSLAILLICDIFLDHDDTFEIFKVCVENPKDFYPRKYLGAARTELQNLVKDKIKDVLGSEGKA